MSNTKKPWRSKSKDEKKKELGIPEKNEPITSVKPDAGQKSESDSKLRTEQGNRNNFKGKNFKSDFDGRKSNYDGRKSNNDGRKSIPDSRIQNRSYRPDRKKHVIQISNLPKDIQVKELVDLVSEWGEIGNVNIKQYSEIVCSYIDFYNKEEADYFVEALHSTPFDNLIIGVKLMNFG